MITDSLIIDTVTTVVQHASSDVLPMSNILPEKAGFDMGRTSEDAC